MNYELVKQLKEAGFRTEELELRWDEHDHDLLKADWEMYKGLYSPTLEELIEACDSRFKRLVRQSSTKFKAQAKGLKKEKVTEPDIHVWGTTPTEAVARLWLALHPLSN